MCTLPRGLVPNNGSRLRSAVTLQSLRRLEAGGVILAGPTVGGHP